ncbi:glutathione S-transferase family protein [Marimonas arenosa]|uniref:glutathione transferase n=1 Tax=Marimonas arenosa TaxID=1795305 RepID=A0AAE3WFI3_9RHOB|nr:glutathione S-transferase family protein [Marimonas arenosa]MDQ2090745.1 glutathione S-transferase family protein [Marimonas arenosa]
MPGRPLLTGYRFSVYTRAARIAFAEKGVGFDYQEYDPFAEGAEGPPHPFGRVPVLRHGRFEVYETAAITAYIDAAFDGPALMPADVEAMARAVQVIGIVDAYAYWPLVRQVYSHAVFRPAMGEPASDAVLVEGLAAAPRMLAAFEAVAAEGLVLGAAFGRADCHLAPMIAAFASAPQGAEMLAEYPALSTWWRRIAARDSLRQTARPLPNGAAGR